jgi:hypothetical protein
MEAGPDFEMSCFFHQYRMVENGQNMCQFSKISSSQTFIDLSGTKNCEIENHNKLLE